AAVNIFPRLEEKVDIVQNAIDLARVLGVEQPKVAILSAVETVTSKIESTIEAAALCKMAERGQITGGILDGPLAFDNAISLQAARTKKITSPVAGQAEKDFDLLLNEAAQRAPVGELVDIDDVGMAAAYLATAYARRLTGSTLYVAAGLNIMA